MLYTAPPMKLPRTTQALLDELQQPLHYLHQAEVLQALVDCGVSRGELSRLTGWPAPLIADRLALNGLEEGLRRRLMEEGAPEGIARALLRLPDEVTRRRIARRILHDRLCIRDAGLLVGAALHRCGEMQQQAPQRRGRVISLVRDHRPYVNAIRDIAGQMKAAGVRATLTERRTAGQLEVTLAMPLRRRRTERHQAM